MFYRTLSPLGPLPSSPLNFNHILLKQGTGTADHLLSLDRRKADRRTDGQMDRQIPRVLQDFIPFGAAAQKGVFPGLKKYMTFIHSRSSTEIKVQ